MRFTLLLTFLLTTGFYGFTQNHKIEGKVTDSKTGLPLTGVSVTLKNSTRGVSTNNDGRYVIGVNDTAQTTLVFSYNGVIKEVEGIELVSGRITNQDVELDQLTKTESEVVVRSTSTSRKESAASVITFQKNTNTVASVIYAESIRRSPDKNTGEVLKRLPGASLQEGKFIIVRGLADRYNQAMLNGVLLTSTEPDRKTFSFDLIPASVIDNIIVNKAFVPELPGEWAGGLIQVNTKDIPAKSFFNIQIGTGFNTQSIGETLYRDGQGGKTDWLGMDDGTRDLPSSYTTKSEFGILTKAEKTAIGKQLRNAWAPEAYKAPLNLSLQANGGFSTKVFNKTLGGNIGLLYSRSNRKQELVNRQNNLNATTNTFDTVTFFNDARFVQDISWGGFGSLTLQLNPRNKISTRTLFNVNSPNSVIQRQGIDNARAEDLRGNEFTFKQNTFFTTQLSGEHNISKPLKFKWYGAFNILDAYVPDQRRILYSKTIDSAHPYRLLLSGTLSQASGSRIYQSLSDYIYTGGGDLAYDFKLWDLKQTVKGGYMFQVKDRLFDAQLFANNLPVNNDSLRLLPASQVFAPENFGNGTDAKIGFDAIQGKAYRYMANTILNAGFIQLDNQFSSKLRMVYGLRIEHYDQLVGSVKKSDPRHTRSVVTDFLPGLNATFKLDRKKNIRFSASQTVIRPELRELSDLNLYDFELNASVQGKPTLKRTKVTNLDLRYELYPGSGEVFTAGVFYKFFKNPIEQLFDEASGGASTFSFQNLRQAISYGAEVELRKKLTFLDQLKNFSFQINAAYIHSRVKDTAYNVDRTLQGQSPYVINAGLLYDLEAIGFNATLLFNQIGERIFLVGSIQGGAGQPNIYEAPRPLLDLQLAKNVLKSKGEVKLNISDIINQRQHFYQNAEGDKTSFQKNTDANRFTRKFGTSVNATFSYSL
jgi:outer membrane receptor for ferrienterochelin and colicin